MVNAHQSDLNSGRMESGIICTECGKKYESEIKLKKHLKHHSKKLLKCEECGIEMEREVKLNNHKRSHKTQPCNYCEIVFTISSLDKHKKSCALNAKKETFSCDQCDYKCNMKATLHRHKKTHEEKEKVEKESPILPCLVCGKIFDTKSHLRQHTRTHLPKITKEPEEYPCDLCEKNYDRKHYLVRHIKSDHLYLLFRESRKPHHLHYLSLIHI